MKGSIFYDVLDESETVNAEKYCHQLKALHNNFKKKKIKRPSSDNRVKIMTLYIKVLHRPFYSLDRALSDNQFHKSLQH